MKKEVSIIIVTYNSSKYIKKLFESILKNKQVVKEVIIIENDSPDKEKTKVVCLKYKKMVNLIYIENNNVGFGNSCNLGVSKASGKYYLFLNPDTELGNDSLSTLMEHRKLSKAEIIGGKAINYDGKTHGSVVRRPNLYIGLFEFTNLGKLFNIQKAHKLFYYEDIEVLKSNLDQAVDAVSGAYLLVTKKSFRKLNGFDEKIFMYLEDVDLGKRANDLGMRVTFCPHSIISHIGGASSKNKYRIRHQAWFDSRKYYFKKHFGVLSNAIIQPLFAIEEILLKKYMKI